MSTLLLSVTARESLGHWSLTFLPIEEIIFVLIPPQNPNQLYTGQLKSALAQAHTLYTLPPTQGFSLVTVVRGMVGMCSVPTHVQTRSVAVNALWGQLLTHV